MHSVDKLPRPDLNSGLHGLMTLNAMRTAVPLPQRQADLHNICTTMIYLPGGLPTRQNAGIVLRTSAKFFFRPTKLTCDTEKSEILQGNQTLYG